LLIKRNIISHELMCDVNHIYMNCVLQWVSSIYYPEFPAAQA
jgi:hypothetical protein